MQIAIIGGGISGLYLAWKLSEKGHKVTVFERKTEIGNSACSGLFSERILDYIPQSRELILNRIKTAFINFPKKKVELSFSKNFLIMSHCELDRMVAELAQKSGVKIILNSNVVSIPGGFDRIIGCDGPLSSVRENLGLKDPRYRLGILGFEEDAGLQEFVETWPIKGGFIWRIPRGKNVEYGIVADPKEAKNVFDAFLKKNDLILNNIQSKLIPQGLIIPRNKKITLAGDATGLTKPWSGGGVIWQLELAGLLLKTFPDFESYRKMAFKRFGLKLFASDLFTSMVYFTGFNLPWFLPSKNKIESDFLIVRK